MTKLAMMLNRKINIIHQLIVCCFSLVILSHNIAEQIVLCVDPDGNINIETGCSTEWVSFNDNLDTNTRYQDDCLNCVDIPLWSYNPDNAFLVQSYDQNPTTRDINTILFSNNELYKSFSYIISSGIYKNPFPPILKNIVLLI